MAFGCTEFCWWLQGYFALTSSAEAAMTAIAEKMAEQWEVKFRKITTDINCAIHGLTDVLEDVLDYGSVALDLPADGARSNWKINTQDVTGLVCGDTL